MFAAALIVFRESLEAALVIGIVAAATRTVARRGWWIALGTAAGVAGSVGVAAVAESISQLAGGSGQELFTAVVLALAVAMLAWHNVWMASHGRQMARHARELGHSVARGEVALTAIVTAVALTVLREGSETVLFLMGIASSADSSRAALAGGSLLGFVAGGAAGVLMYAGLLRVPVNRLFVVTGWLILLLAAGMAGQFARVLIQADMLPPLASPLWDTSKLMPDDSILGVLLHALFGYQAQPSATQVLFYCAAFVLILVAMRRAQAHRAA
jgi:high-affinity iron transporter